MPRQTVTFEERIEAEKAQMERRAACLKDGSLKDELLRRIRRLETAEQLSQQRSHIEGSACLQVYDGINTDKGPQAGHAVPTMQEARKKFASDPDLSRRFR